MSVREPSSYLCSLLLRNFGGIHNRKQNIWSDARHYVVLNSTRSYRSSLMAISCGYLLIEVRSFLNAFVTKQSNVLWSGQYVSSLIGQYLDQTPIVCISTQKLSRPFAVTIIKLLSIFESYSVRHPIALQVVYNRVDKWIQSIYIMPHYGDCLGGSQHTHAMSES